MYAISKEFAFEAAHRLTRVPVEHKCARMHGHSYRLRVTVHAAAVDDRGMVVDYADLSIVGDWLAGHIDHQVLNDVLDLEPTAENLARHFHGVTAELVDLPDGAQLAVAVSETARTWAEWSPA